MKENQQIYFDKLTNHLQTLSNPSLLQMINLPEAKLLTTETGATHIILTNFNLTMAIPDAIN